jgi:hypothetical protein
VSEYQSYRFEAIDRPLTAEVQAALRKYSSRATITSRRFQVDYAWGYFKGNAREWMAKHFDAFLYQANRGTREMMLRLPRTVLPLERAEQYCRTDAATAREEGDHVIIDFRADEEGGSRWISEDDDTLELLLPVRAELATGDLRALYVAWLISVELGEIDEAEREPPCPPGLSEPTPALRSLARFLLVDPDLLEAAAAESPALADPDDAALERWIEELSASEKTSILTRLARGPEVHARAELLRRFRASRIAEVPTSRSEPRTAGQLLAAAETCAERRRQREAEAAARERARREREAAEARERRLVALTQREAEAWREVDALIASQQGERYDEAVALLADLREVCVRAGREEVAARHLSRLRDEHGRKRSLMKRLRKSGLAPQPAGDCTEN